MDRQGICITSIGDTAPEHVSEHSSYEYLKYNTVERRPGCPAKAAVYELMPGKANYPYHYHTCSEEVFYILSGTGFLDTPDGRKTVAEGQFICCPPGQDGAHKLTNASKTEKLVYIDFDTVHSPDVVYYPDSNKVGVYIDGREPSFFIEDTSVDYYEGE